MKKSVICRSSKLVFASLLASIATGSCAFAAQDPVTTAVESLNAVDPDAISAWNFYAASAGEHNVGAFTLLTPFTDASNDVMLKNEGDAAPPLMLWELGYAAGPITIRPESDRHAANGKGDLIAMWKVEQAGRYQVQVEVDNVGTDVLGGDGGALIISQLRARETNDSHVIEQIGVPSSGPQSPHVQRTVTVDANVGDSIVLRINAGGDGYADQWKMRYSIARSTS